MSTIGQNNSIKAIFAYDYVLRRKAIASETAFKQHLAILSGRYPHLTHKLEEKRQLTEQITFLRLTDTYINLFGCELVVASACQTALGKIESGDTITGFRRSFIQSGAKTLIISLWSVPDVATAILMQRFYHYLLQEKRGKADSLKQAKRDICHLTIGTMRQEWLTEDAIIEAQKYSQGVSEHLRELSQQPENYRPYEHPKHWAAFLCLGSPYQLTVNSYRL